MNIKFSTKELPAAIISGVIIIGIMVGLFFFLK